jgi:hypothetical protein
VELPERYHKIGRQLAFGTPKAITAAIMSDAGTKDEVYDIRDIRTLYKI